MAHFKNVILTASEKTSEHLSYHEKKGALGTLDSGIFDINCTQPQPRLEVRDAT